MPFISCFPVHTHMYIYTVWTAQADITQLLLVLVCFLMKASPATQQAFSSTFSCSKYATHAL